MEFTIAPKALLAYYMASWIVIQLVTPAFVALYRVLRSRSREYINPTSDFKGAYFECAKELVLFAIFWPALPILAVVVLLIALYQTMIEGVKSLWAKKLCSRTTILGE